MLSQYDPLYNVLDSFPFHERRFQNSRIVYSIDEKCTEDFIPFATALPMGPWHTDLMVSLAVAYMLQPRHCHRFLQTVYTNTPQDIETSLYRQEGVRELVEKPDLARRIEDALNIMARINPELQKRNSKLISLIDYRRGSWRNGVLKPITPYNLQLLSLYTQAVQQLAQVLKEAESRPLERAYRFITEEVIDTPFFKDIRPVFEISYFKDDRVSLDATLARDGSYHAVIVHRKADETLTKDAARMLTRIPARVGGFLHTFQLPSTYAMEATNRLISSHEEDIMHPSRIIGPLEFYTTQAGFYRRMQEAGQPVHFPQILPKEERRLFLPDARNPLLMYRQDGQGTILRSERVAVGSDIHYSPDHNMGFISGPNQAGKSVFLRTLGIQIIQALNGGALPIGEGGFVSVVDGIHTHFSGKDNLVKGEGTFLQELHRYKKEVFEKMTPHSVALLDEPTTGTDTRGSISVSTRFLRRHHRLGTATFMTTHHHEIGNLVDDGTFYAGFNLCPRLAEDPETGKMRKTFEIVSGRSNVSLAEDVAIQAGMGEEDLDRIILERVSAGNLDENVFRTKKKSKKK